MVNSTTKESNQLWKDWTQVLNEKKIVTLYVKTLNFC